MDILSIFTDSTGNSVNFINAEDFTALLVRFAFNLSITLIIVRGIYYQKRKKKDFLFSYFSVSTVVFFLCFLLESVKLELGFALGLFAIFGIIRYRTKVIPIREMTYLFVIIGISVINALASSDISFVELLFTNFALIIIIFLLERINYPEQKQNFKKLTLLENINEVDLRNEKELLKFLANKTHLQIKNISIEKIDYQANSVEITIYY